MYQGGTGISYVLRLWFESTRQHRHFFFFFFFFFLCADYDMTTEQRVVQQYQIRKTAGSLPNLAQAQTLWLDEVAEATAQYWSRASGGWGRFNIKARPVRSGRLGPARVEIEAKGWTADIRYEVGNGNVKVYADLAVQEGELGSANVDLLELLTEADKDTFERVYNDRTTVEIGDVSPTLLGACGSTVRSLTPSRK